MTGPASLSVRAFAAMVWGALFTVVFLPLIYGLWEAASTGGGGFTFGARQWRLLGNSVTVAVGVTVVCTLIGVPLPFNN